MRFASLSVAVVLALAAGCGGSNDDNKGQGNAAGGQTNAGGAHSGGTKSATGGTATPGGSSNSNSATTSASTAVNSSGGAASVGGSSAAAGGSAGGTTSSTVASTATGGQSSVAGTGGATVAVLTGTGGSTLVGSSSTTGGTTQSLLPTGGATGAGGSQVSTGVGGGSVGGATTTGGTSAVVTSTGGASTTETSTGGTSAAVTGVGGLSSTGGTSAVVTGVGGLSSTGGAETGGVTVVGGTSSSSGGTETTGGTTAVGGTTATGGTAATGGTSGTGGTTGTIPAGWSCDAAHYGTGDGCDCGCGVVDPDCEVPSSADCPTASSSLCCDTFLQAGSCVKNIKTAWPFSAIKENDNAACLNAPPNGWTCVVDAYGDGVCDHGCGAVDSDCSGSSVNTTCFRTGSCASVETGCDIILSNDPAHCDITAPAGWHCPQAYYDDKQYCDCGCGIPDPDCTGKSIDECGCGSGSCSLVDDVTGACLDIDPNNFAGCLQNWSCEPSHRNDGICDCGCGDDGTDCKTTTGVAVCSTCANPGSCATSCDDISVTNNTTCKQ